MKSIIGAILVTLFLSFEILAVIKIEIDDQKKEEEKEDQEEAEEEEAEEEAEEEKDEPPAPPDAKLSIGASNKTNINWTATVFAEAVDMENTSIWLQSLVPKNRFIMNFGTLIAEPGHVFKLDPKRTWVFADEKSVKCDIIPAEEKKEDDGDKGDEGKEENGKEKEAVDAKEDEAKGEPEEKKEEAKEKSDDKGEKEEEEPEYIAKKSIDFYFYNDESGPKCVVKLDTPPEP